MTIIDLFNNYWSINRTNPMPPMCATLYFYLLHECNIRRWINPFELRTRTIELELGISRDAINDSRNMLKQRGLIDFQNGKGKAPARYKLEGVKLSADAFVVAEADNKTDNKNGVVGINDNKTDNKPTTNPTTPQITHSNIEDIKNKDNIDATLSASPPLQFTLPFEEQKPKKPKKKKEPPPDPPTLEEVRQQFLISHADTRLINWELEARSFYDWFSYNDWKDRSGRSILRKWQSRANIWINDKEDKEQKVKQSNPTKPNERTYASGVADADLAKQQRDERFARHIAEKLSRADMPPEVP